MKGPIGRAIGLAEASRAASLGSALRRKHRSSWHWSFRSRRHRGFGAPLLDLHGMPHNGVVDARWSETDRPSSRWKIPGERMKMHQDHVVPLPALAILDKMRDGSQGEWSSLTPTVGCFQRMRCSLYRIAWAAVTLPCMNSALHLQPSH